MALSRIKTNSPRAHAPDIAFAPRVAILGRINTAGGSSRVIQMLHSGLANHGCAVSAAFPEGSRWPLEEWYESSGHTVSFLKGFPKAAERSRLKTLFTITRWIRQQPFEIANIQYSGGAFSFLDALPFFLARKRLVISGHHPVAAEEMSELSRLNTRFAARIASAIVVTSDFHRKILVDLGLPKSKIHVIPNGIDLDELRSGRPKGTHRVPGKLMVGTVCRQEKDKRVPQLAEALADSATFREKGFWLIAGRGTLEEEIRKSVEAALPEQVRFLGPVADIAQVFASLDLFALVSELEGFGLVYAEAAAFGVPSIATSRGNAQELIESGRTGHLVDPDDRAGIVRSIEELLADDDARYNMGARAKALVEERFTSQRMTQDYLALFASVLSKTRVAS